ncbi:MAG: hypothetical protein P8129_14545 [Anaerolineae bacterium]
MQARRMRHGDPLQTGQPLGRHPDQVGQVAAQAGLAAVDVQVADVAKEPVGQDPVQFLG